MTNDVDARSPEDRSGCLNDLLRGEFVAVNSYQLALRSAESRASVDAAEILVFASEHRRTVVALEGAVRVMGGVPASEGKPSRSFSRLWDSASLRELLFGEELSLKRYEAAMGGFDGDARDLIEIELIPRQRQHIAGLTAIIARLAA